MVSHYIVTRTIMGICEATVRRPETRVSKRWWKEEGLDLGEDRAVAEAAEEGEL